MRLYELINPSDPYTFYAPTVEVAGAAVVLLSPGFGAVPVDAGADDESTPILFGWDHWLKDRGIDRDWVDAHGLEIADALDSFLIGKAAARVDVETMLEMLSPEKREEWRASRQDRHRSSVNKIGEAAYAIAKRLREAAQ